MQVKISGHRVELGEIESTLISYPGIKQSVAIVEEKDNLASGNNKYLIAYYVKELGVNNNDSINMISDWKKLYHLTYSKLAANTGVDNFVGWNSSYTREPINRHEMSEWREETVAKINQLPIKRILEIGSGSGLLLSKLVEKSSFYYAFDFSEQAIKYNQKIVNNLGYSKKFEGYVANADKIDFKKYFEKYDTVILNSVTQYFPSLAYLEDILNKAIENLSRRGQIFIGDVRDSRLLDCFAYSVLNFKNSSVTVSDIEYFKLKEKELLVAPEFFLSFGDNKNVSYVELLPKLGKAINEMSCYRYDVVLHINKNMDDSIADIDQGRFERTINIESMLSGSNEDILYLKYPNFRIAKDYIECRYLYAGDCELSLDDVSGLLNITRLTQIFGKFGYKIKLYLDIESPLYMDIVAYKGERPELEKVAIACQRKPLDKENLANNPLQNMKRLDSEYVKELRSYLESRLPDYMIPQYLISINEIPLNSNGKIDYRALPKPELEISDNYIAPQTKIEKELCEIFGGILNLAENKIGIHDNFFKIGGNSILAIKLIYKINNQLGYKIKVVDVFTKNTIHSLANYLSTVKPAWHLVTQLNHTDENKLNIFMIHPGFADSEVYMGLVTNLLGVYNCYGINNYNLHHRKKIKDIQNLARLYLSSIMQIREQTNHGNQPFIILGWSLGGQIALNIANILEQNGYENIHLILVDSAYPDDSFSHNLSQILLDPRQLNDFARQAGYDFRYVTKVKNNISCDMSLSCQKVPINL
ncbi:MAG TPA: phosphopantetheine-binding protein, partial [Aquella sp.]|nr:phosphopantetheine-binding protein [Aquella sp.]